jgi:DNA-binding transcriptional LysR family regulator
MDLSSLEIFCAVAEEHSVTRAAQRLSRAQSNVTTRVKQLEETLKVQLFSRDGKQMTLTPHGHTMLEYAQRLLSLADEARDAMAPAVPGGVLRIGAIESMAAARLPALLSAYHGNWPQVGLNISIGTSQSLVDDVANSRLDCAFVASEKTHSLTEPNNEFSDRGLTATHVYTEELLLVLPPNHPRVRRPEDIALPTLAAFSTGCTYRCVLERWLDAHGAGGDDRWKVLELASYHSILACVAAGSCFALCPRSILNLQRTPMDVETQPLTTINTYLVSRSAYESTEYDNLLGSLQTAMSRQLM